MKLWAGRFQKETDKQVNDFNSSIAFDVRLYKEDIEGSIAHATMLGEQEIIDKEDSQKIVNGLLQILADIDEGKVEFTALAEDIHMNIEVLLTERIGDVGKKLHTARSRNDQIALDMRMHLKKEVLEVIANVKALQKALLAKAKDNIETIMPGYTHLQRAQPVTFSHYMLAYAQMLKRDVGRLNDCYKRMDKMPLGSGALATAARPRAVRAGAPGVRGRSACARSASRAPLPGRSLRGSIP